ncbi:hypothetical protein B0T17DRAFT_613148 [Bombardia bombarda]|uniref:Aminoglycoside phosphotransferase domain-containing protein n=1 Tax=Bombardia bombarda TaxID=252184 RepID=A0AA40CG92_9PEZI|nr:hypothetical protein B0T17DRAFT_613148 [Bombardia bombarda]
MLALVYRSNPLSPAPSHSIREVLTSYGLKDIIDWDHISGSVPVREVSDPSSDVILVNADHALGNMAIRRLTLNSVRLPSTFAVWDGPSRQELVAARIAMPIFDQLFIQKQGPCGDLNDMFRKLVDNKLIRDSYTVQQFSDISSIRIGGSFAGSGIRRYFGKSASGLGAKKLRDEIRMYQSLPQELRTHYPQLLFAKDDEASGVTMGTAYEDYPNLRDLLLNMEITVPEAVGLLKQVLEFEFCQAFLGHKQAVPDNYLHDYHFHRVWRRIAISMDLDASFGPLVAAPWLVVNGERLPNVPAMLLRLEKDQSIAGRLRPDGVSPFIHSDLHLENILCDVAGSRFWLVDPRGYPVCDIYYDLGKLAHSYHSYYDLLHEGRHRAEFSVSADGQTGHVNYEIHSRRLVERYSDLDNRMNEVVHELLEKHGEKKEDIDLRVRFNEAMHFCSDMPFHINKGAKPCIAQPIYGVGAKLLAEVLQMLGIDLEECVGLQGEALARLAVMGKQAWRFEG